MLSKSMLSKLYLQDKLSVPKIAKKIKCSEHTVNYWIGKHDIPKRSISEAVYCAWNPDGDPFSVRKPKSMKDAKLYGLGVGLYWGEGTKKDKSSIRLGNSDPRLIRKFLEFLRVIYGIDERKLRFGLQIFGDMDKEKTLKFWMRSIGITRRQFFPTIVVTPYRGVGNYREKTKYGVVTIHFSNRKLRDIICDAIEKESMRI